MWNVATPLVTTGLCGVGNMIWKSHLCQSPSLIPKQLMYHARLPKHSRRTGQTLRGRPQRWRCEPLGCEHDSASQRTSTLHINHMQRVMLESQDKGLQKSVLYPGDSTKLESASPPCLDVLYHLLMRIAEGQPPQTTSTRKQVIRGKPAFLSVGNWIDCASLFCGRSSKSYFAAGKGASTFFASTATRCGLLSCCWFWRLPLGVWR